MSATAELRALLTSDWQPAVEVASEARARGLTDDQIRAARKKLGVTLLEGAVSRRDGRWWWKLPGGQCPTCGAPCRRPWALDGQGGDYYASGRPSSPVMPDDDPAITPEAETSSPTMPPVPVPRYEPAGPPTCSVCGKASASNRGEQCPWQSTGGVRCVGTMQ